MYNLTHRIVPFSMNMSHRIEPFLDDSKNFFEKKKKTLRIEPCQKLTLKIELSRKDQRIEPSFSNWLKELSPPFQYDSKNGTLKKYD